MLRLRLFTLALAAVASAALAASAAAATGGYNTAGDILIADQFNDQVIEVTHDRNPRIVFAQGKIREIGTGLDRCNAPYDAKQVGDYTGLAVPSGF
jgi:hypothetical protein